MFTALILTLGCDDPGQYGYAGYDMVDHFPLDGQREWTYTNEGIAWRLNVDMLDNPVVSDTTTIHTFEYWQADANGVSANLLMTLDVSSDTYNGVQFHGYEVISDPIDWDTGSTDDSGDSGVTGWGPAELVSFDPPLVLAESKMAPGDTVVTSTGGSTWTSTFKFQEPCPNNWIAGENEWSCLYVELEDGDGDLETGARISGRYWLAPRYGMSWFQWVGDDEKWILARAEWAPDDE
ncbi:MAG TPA: hypothetical protein QGF58_21040 [Myxococcota bacterium]|nr:hypothetical protein [Myxococcota bacterium]